MLVCTWYKNERPDDKTREYFFLFEKTGKKQAIIILKVIKTSYYDRKKARKSSDKNIYDITYIYYIQLCMECRTYVQKKEEKFRQHFQM